MIQRDLIDSTYARFGEMAIDFWSGLEDGEANIESIYDSGDGVHLENSAHKILLQRVLDRNISEYLLSNRNTMTSSAWQNQIARLHVFPNPSTDSISLKNITPPFDVYIYDPEGRLIFENKNYSDSKIKLVAKGRQFVKIIKGDLLMGSWVDRM